MNEYLKQAKDFCEKTGTTFEVKFLRRGKYFHGDKESRDIYQITIKRGNRSYTTEFGQSISNSGEYIVKNDPRKRIFGNENDAAKIAGSINDVIKNPNKKAPDEYDFFASVEKYDVGTFEDFCSEFGYNDLPLSDYQKVKDIYEAVVKQHNALLSMYNDQEMDELREIQ